MTGTPPRGAGRLSNTPSWRGYLVAWLVSASVFVLGLLLVVLIAEGFDPDELGDLEEFPDVLCMAVAYLAVTLVVSGLGLLPVVLVLHFLLRGVEAQWVHVAALGTAITVLYGVAFALEDPVLGAAGLAPGAAAAVGRLAVAGPRWRQRRRVRVRVRTGW
jgi:hypothetical protein